MTLYSPSRGLRGGSMRLKGRDRPSSANRVSREEQHQLVQQQQQQQPPSLNVPSRNRAMSMNVRQGEQSPRSYQSYSPGFTRTKSRPPLNPALLQLQTGGDWGPGDSK